jgi:ParB/RepB/Spo0J family partition protein
MFCAEFYQYALAKYGQDGVENAPPACNWCRYAENGPLDFDEEEWEEAGIPEGWQPYELVYGHRRVEAARRAGLEEIEAIVGEASDKQAFKEAYIENMLREGMDDVQISDALHRIAEDEGVSTAKELAVLGYGAVRTIARYFRVSEQPQSVRQMFQRQGGIEPLTAGHLDAVTESGLAERRQYASSLVTEEGEAVLSKAQQEQLTIDQTRRVAEAVAIAPSPEAKRVLLEAQYSPVIHDPEMIRERAARLGAHDPMYQDTTPTKQQQYNQTPEVRATVDSVIDAAKRWNELIKVIRSMTEVGKLAPESRQFIAHRARQLAKTLTDWANELEAKE